MSRAPAALALLALVACDDTVFASDQGGYEPTWLGMQVFLSEHCVECHPSVAEPDWPEDLEHDVLDGTEQYVVPGIPEDSLLWQVVADEGPGAAEVGVMPPGRPLSPVQVEHVRVWIENGAPL